jgi:hypothetical protein
MNSWTRQRLLVEAAAWMWLPLLLLPPLAASPLLCPASLHSLAALLALALETAWLAAGSACASLFWLASLALSLLSWHAAESVSQVLWERVSATCCVIVCAEYLCQVSKLRQDAAAAAAQQPNLARKRKNPLCPTPLAASAQAWAAWLSARAGGLALPGPAVAAACAFADALACVCVVLQYLGIEVGLRGWPALGVCLVVAYAVRKWGSMRLGAIWVAALVAGSMVGWVGMSVWIWLHENASGGGSALLLWKILVSPFPSFSLFSFSSLVSSLVSSLYPSLYNLRDYNTAYLVAFVPGLACFPHVLEPIFFNSRQFRPWEQVLLQSLSPLLATGAAEALIGAGVVVMGAGDVEIMSWAFSKTLLPYLFFALRTLHCLLVAIALAVVAFCWAFGGSTLHRISLFYLDSVDLRVQTSYRLVLMNTSLALSLLLGPRLLSLPLTAPVVWPLLDAASLLCTSFLGVLFCAEMFFFYAPETSPPWSHTVGSTTDPLSTRQRWTAYALVLLLLWLQVRRAV